MRTEQKTFVADFVNHMISSGWKPVRVISEEVEGMNVSSPLATEAINEYIDKAGDGTIIFDNGSKRRSVVILPGSTCDTIADWSADAEFSKIVCDFLDDNT